MSDPALEALAAEARHAADERPSARGRRAFLARPTTRVCLAVLAFLLTVAALAPLLALDRPLLIRRDGDLGSPWLEALSGGEVFGLFAFAGALLAPAALVLPSRRVGRRVALAVLSSFLLAGTATALLHRPAFETRRYAREIPVRRELARLDEAAVAAVADGWSGPERRALRDDLLALEASMPLLANVAGEIDARVIALEEAGDPGAAAIALAEAGRVNDRELAALEDAIFPPHRFDPDDPTHPRLEPPSAEHVLGTDASGRDLLARLIHGAKTSLGIALAATLLATLAAAVLGGAAGYFGGWADWWISRLIETAMCLPALFLLVVLAAYVPPAPGGRSVFLVVVVAGLIWTHPARLFRAEVMRVRNADFVLAARALGASHVRIFWKHVVPNALGPLLVSATFTVGGVVLLEAALSFLGLGLHDAPSWGQALRDARQTSRLDQTWHLAVFPGLALFATVFSLNWLGDAWRDAGDPRSR